MNPEEISRIISENIHTNNGMNEGFGDRIKAAANSFMNPPSPSLEARRYEHIKKEARGYVDLHLVQYYHQIEKTNVFDDSLDPKQGLERTIFF